MHLAFWLPPSHLPPYPTALQLRSNLAFSKLSARGNASMYRIKDEPCVRSVTRVQISLFFWDFWILVIFRIFGPKMGPKGPGRASIGSTEGLRFIWIKFQPKWAHLGPNGAPFYFSISQKPILGPNSSKSTLGSGPTGPKAPSNIGSRAHGGRRQRTAQLILGGRHMLMHPQQITLTS